MSFSNRVHPENMLKSSNSLDYFAINLSMRPQQAQDMVTQRNWSYAFNPSHPGSSAQGYLGGTWLVGGIEPPTIRSWDLNH